MKPERTKKEQRVAKRREFLKKVGRRAAQTSIAVPAAALLMAASAKPAEAEMYTQDGGWWIP